MQKQRLIILIVGIILGLAAVFMTKSYIAQQSQVINKQAQQKLAQIQANQAAILVAKQDIMTGTVIQADMLDSVIIPAQYVQPRAATSLDRVAGMIVTAPISKGEQISLSKLSQHYGRQASSLAALTPVGKRAITIAIDNTASLAAGMIRPGDYVDIITLLPMPVTTMDGKQKMQTAVFPLFQNILVLAVGQDTGGEVAQSEGRYKKEEKKEFSPLITLALSSQEANLIAFVQEQGKIRLVLRSPADSGVQPISPASWDTLFQYVMPQAVEPKPKEDEPSASGYVEIYRGLTKEKVPIYGNK